MPSSGFSYLCKSRHGIWYLQLRIPKQIRDTNPHLPPLVRKSLKTRNRREALRLARKMVVWMEDTNYTANLADWEAKAEREARLYHVGLPLFTELNELEATGDSVAVEEFLASLTGREQEALAFMVARNNALIDRFERLLKDGDRKAISDFIHGLSEPDKTRLLSLQVAQTLKEPPAPTPTPSQRPQQANSRDIPLDEAFERWKNAHNPPVMAKSSFEEYTRMIARFIEIILHITGGNMPKISEVTAELVGNYKDIEARIPKGKRPKNKSISELLEMGGELKSAKTTKGIFGNVGHFIKWLAGEGYPIQPNVYEVLTHFRKIKKSEQKKRVPFDDSDIQALFHSEEYRYGRWRKASDFWVPLIALFSGMTRNEILQLYVSDIYKKDGHWVIDINEQGDKRLKVSSADGEDDSSTGRARIIPVHKDLLKLGFIDFVEHQKQKGHKQLFPREKRNSRGQYGPYGNRFRRYRDKVGANPRNNREFRDFHSFRHLVKTKLRESNKKDDGIIDDSLGHTSALRSNVGRTYDHAERIKFKAEALNKLKYDCLDLEKIRPWKYHLFAKK